MTALYRIAYAARAANPIWLYLAAVLVIAATAATVVAINADGVLLALPGVVFDTVRGIAEQVADTAGGVLPW